MLLLVGLMGMLAVGATALVGLEVATEPDTDQDSDSSEDGIEVSDTHETGGEDLIEIAAGLSEAMPEGEEVAIASVGDDLYITESDGWLADQPDDDTNADNVADDMPPFDAANADLDDDRVERLTSDALRADASPGDITDFSADEDRLVVVFDDQVDPDPTLGLEEDEADIARTHVTLNGIRIAAVDEADGLTLDHITLVPQSADDGTAQA